MISSVSRNLTAHIENLTLTGSANLTASGNSLNNTLTGNSGNNILYGYDGNDILNGGAGADTMFGAAGNDYYVVDNAGDITVEGAAGPAGGIDTVESWISRNLNANFENLILMGSAANAYGNILDNALTGTPPPIASMALTALIGLGWRRRRRPTRCLAAMAMTPTSSTMPAM
ncbi:MAG: hypothetical protein R3C30_08045 [Hyphomonadaceae bacterium]